MSYSGYTEYLSEEGFYWVVDSFFESEKENLGPNNSRPFYYHHVNQTNGYGEERRYIKENNLSEELSYFDEDAPKEEIGFIDIWHEDHYGNKFATKSFKYKPDLKYWQKVEF